MLTERQLDQLKSIDHVKMDTLDRLNNDKTIIKFNGGTLTKITLLEYGFGGTRTYVDSKHMGQLMRWEDEAGQTGLLVRGIDLEDGVYFYARIGTNEREMRTFWKREIEHTLKARPSSVQARTASVQEKFAELNRRIARLERRRF